MLDLNQFTGFTPGPWQIQITGGEKETVTGRELGLCVNVLGPTYEIRNTNAKLIAAAPELLDLCWQQQTEIERFRVEVGRLMDLPDPPESMPLAAPHFNPE